MSTIRAEDIEDLDRYIEEYLEFNLRVEVYFQRYTLTVRLILNNSKGEDVVLTEHTDSVPNM